MTVLIIFSLILQTVISLIMLSVGGRGVLLRLMQTVVIHVAYFCNLVLF